MAPDQDKHECNDGEDGFGIEVWFHAQRSSTARRRLTFFPL
jgi:hypothetical protein